MRIYIYSEAALVKIDNLSRAEALVLKSLDVTLMFLKVFYISGPYSTLGDLRDSLLIVQV